ncbi:Protein HIGH ARSENIC CONTENT 1 [Arabidopsis thaliana]
MYTYSLLNLSHCRRQTRKKRKTDHTEGFLMEETNQRRDVEDVETVDVYTAKGFLSTGHRYLDVRTNEEFAKSHVEEALNIPYMFKTDEGRVINPDFLSQVASVCKKDEHLIVACNAGGRGSRACVDLLNEGYDHVANMGGGYSAWVDAGFAGDKPPEDLKIACKFRPKEN